MSVSNLTPYVQYTGNGATVAFSITFPFLSNSDVSAKLIDINTGATTALTYGTHYSVSGSTLTMVTAPDSSHYLYIYRTTPRTQATSFAVGQTYITQQVADMADKLTYLLQEIELKITSYAVAATSNGALSAGTDQQVASGGTITVTAAQRQLFKVQGLGAAVTVSATVGIQNGVSDLQEIELLGGHATNTVKLLDSGNVDLNGPCILGLGDMIRLVWKASDSMWYETSRRV